MAIGLTKRDKRGAGQSITKSRAKSRAKGAKKDEKARDEAGQFGGVFGSKNLAVREKATRDLWKKVGVKDMPGRPGKPKKKTTTKRKTKMLSLPLAKRSKIQKLKRKMKKKK